MSNQTKYGSGALNSSQGNDNTGLGAFASYNNTTAFNNTAVGSNSAFYTTTGSNNTSVGAGSLCNNTTGSLNTAVGSSALEGTVGQSVGDGNVAIGAQALYSNTGDQNTAIGKYSLLGNTNGSYNTCIGANTNTDGVANYNYSTAIGANATITSSNQIMMGGDNGSGMYPNVMIPGQAFLTNYSATGNSEQIVPKSYVDTVGAGLKPTQTCICATTANINLSSTSAPSAASTDGFNLSSQADGTYNILVVNQGSVSQELTSNVDNGVYIVTKSGSGTTYTWARPTAPVPMSTGYNAVGAFSFIEFGTSYGKKALVQYLNPAVIGTNSLQYQILFQLNISAGQGLNTTIVGSGVQLNVDSDLDFITNIDNTGGTLELGTNSTNTTIGATGGNDVVVNTNLQVNGNINTTQDAVINTLTVGQGNAGNDTSTAVGYRALYSDASGLHNTAIGYQALTSNTIGKDNVSVGYEALSDNTQGCYNIAIGQYALTANTGALSGSTAISGMSNVAVGINSLATSTQGISNVAVGSNTLQILTSGNFNSVFGDNAGINQGTGSYNTFLGSSTGQAVGDGNSYTYSTAIGANAIITASNQMVLGGSNSGTYPQVIAQGGAAIGTFPATGNNNSAFLNINTANSSSYIYEPDSVSNKGYGVTITTSKASSLSPAYSMGLSVDYNTGFGFINCAGNGSVQPLVLNPRGGDVNIGYDSNTCNLSVNGVVKRKIPVLSLYNNASTPISVPSGIDVPITFPSTDTSQTTTTTTGITYSTFPYNSYTGGQFQNTSGSNLVVLVTFTIPWQNTSNNTTGSRAVFLLYNSTNPVSYSSTRYCQSDLSGDNDEVTHNCSVTLNMASNDYFSIWAWQNSGTALNLTGTSGNTYFVNSMIQITAL